MDGGFGALWEFEVMSKDKIIIRFKSGFEMEQTLATK
jgi:hypothetical protein